MVEARDNLKEGEASKEVESLRTQLEEGLTKVCELSEKLKETKLEHVRLLLILELIITTRKKKHRSRKRRSNNSVRIPSFNVFTNFAEAADVEQKQVFIKNLQGDLDKGQE